MTPFIKKYNQLIVRLKTFTLLLLSQLISLTSSLSSYYSINNLLWQDGLIIDFLQKKIMDKWIRRFLIVSSYLFNEKIMFNFVVRFYIDFVVWPMTFKGPFTVSNVGSLLSFLIVVTLFLILLFNLHALYFILL